MSCSLSRSKCRLGFLLIPIAVALALVPLEGLGQDKKITIKPLPPLQKAVDGDKLEKRVREALTEKIGAKPAKEIAIQASPKGVVSLKGKVADEAAKKRIGKVVEDVPGVARVDNQLQITVVVAPPKKIEPAKPPPVIGKSKPTTTKPTTIVRNPFVAIRAGDQKILLPIFAKAQMSGAMLDVTTTAADPVRLDGAVVNWGRQTFIDWSSPKLYRTFRWTTKADAASARWQVTQFPFTGQEKNWEKPAGLVADGKLSDLSKPVFGEFVIDFARFAPLPATKKTPAVGKGATKPIEIKPIEIKPGGSGDKSPPLRLVSAAHTFVSRQYYVRVVPLDAQGQPAGAATNFVVVGYGVLPPSPKVEFRPEDLPKYGDPGEPVNVRILRYDPVRLQHATAPYRFVVTRDVKIAGTVFWRAGQKIYAPPDTSDPSVWERITDAIGDVVDFFEDAVNWVSDAYNDIKAFAVSTIVDVLAEIPIPGVDRNAYKMLVGAALDAGLMAMGVPPSIPDFDELVSMGKDYLAAKLAEEVGIPQDLSRKLIDEVANKAKEASNGSGRRGGATWLKPDPDYQYRDAMVTLEVTRGQHPAWAGKPNVKSMRLIDAGNIFKPVTLPMPQMKPGAKLRIPVVLEPNLVPPNLGIYSISEMWQEWWQKYGDGKVRFEFDNAEGQRLTWSATKAFPGK